MPNESNDRVPNELPADLTGLYDLPLVVSLLPRAAQADSTGELKRRGETLARERRLFVAAEAIGHVRKRELLPQSAKVVDNLGFLIRGGNSLHKVRALRAMRFVAADECLPHLAAALRDRSTWVAATALRALFRLGLRTREPRRIVLDILLRWFLEALDPRPTFLRVLVGMAKEGPPAPWLRKLAPPPRSDLSRGVISGLLRERGGRILGILAMLLFAVAGVWIALVAVAAFGAYMALVCLLFAAAACVFVLAPLLFEMNLGFEDVLSLRARRPTLREGLQAGVNYGLAVLCFVLGLRADDFSPQYPLLASGFAFSLLTMPGRESETPRDAPLQLRDLARGAMAMVCAYYARDAIVALVLLGALAGFFVIPVLAKQVALFIRNPKDSPLTLIVMVVVVGAGVLTLAVPVMGAVFVGFLFLLVSSWPLLVLVVEPWLVGSIRARLLWRQRPFASVAEKIEYLDEIVGQEEYPVGARVAFALQLLDVPFADAALVSRLQDIAARDIDPRIQDAVYQVVLAAETRMQRGQAPADTRPPPLVRPVTPGELFRPYTIWFYVAGALISGATLLFGTKTAALPLERTAGVTPAILACAFLAISILSMGHASGWRMWLTTLGCAFACVSWTREDQLLIAAANNPLLSTWVADWYGMLGCAIGHLAYVLESDARVTEELSESRTKWLVAGFSVAVCVASALQGPALFDYLEARRAPMPRFETKVAGTVLGTLVGVPSDRVVRLALIRRGKESWTEGMGTFPLPGKRRPGADPEDKASLKKDYARIYADDDACKGEAWIVPSAEHAGSATIEPYPNGCLTARSLAPGVVDLGTRAGCDLRQTKIVAMTFVPRQTAYLRKQVSVANAKAEFERSEPSGSGLLQDLYSVVVQSTWSTVLAPTTVK